MIAAIALLTVFSGPKANLALRFDGNSMASIEDCAALRLTDEMTFEAWVFLEQPILHRTFAYLLSKNYGGSGYEVTVLDRPNHRLSTSDFAALPHSSKPSVPIGKWVHVAYARSLKRAKLYVNGELSLETQTGSPLQSNDLRVFIGSSDFVDQEGAPCRFIGSIDEVQIWKVARSQANIKRTMGRRPTGRERALVVYLPFDEGAGQLLKNRTGRTGPMTMGQVTDPDGADPAWVAGPPLR